MKINMNKSLPTKPTKKFVTEALFVCKFSMGVLILLAGIMAFFEWIGITIVFLYLAHLHNSNVNKWIDYARSKGWYRE